MLPGEKVLLDDVTTSGEELPPRLDVLEDLAVDRLLHRGQHRLGHRSGQVAVEGAEPVDDIKSFISHKVEIFSEPSNP